MGEGAWSFRTTDGVVTVHQDAITARSTPGPFLASQAARWREGGWGERLRAAFVVVAFLVTIAGLGYHLYRTATHGFSWRTLFYVGTLGYLVYAFWRAHGRTVEIPRSAIESVTLEPDARRFTVTHGTGAGPLAGLRAATTETTFTAGTDDDLRDARESLRLRGIEVAVGSDDPWAETTHRIVSEDGGHYCERCGSLVTPNDKVCRSCDYALWVEAESA